MFIFRVLSIMVAGIMAAAQSGTSSNRNLSHILNWTVIVSALGYFVDIYDLLLFSIVRVSSLRSLGVVEDRLLETGVYLLNMQMLGMLVGGVIWGIVGDKKGRISVLFGSIFLYSVANILNGFVTTVEMYAILRLFAGIGLAGELGAAITLVSEVMSKESRGYGTTVVAAVGILGAVLAAFVADHFTWQTAYFIGGGLGLALLVMRITMFESGMYDSMKSASCRRGDFGMLFTSSARFFKYLHCILIGLPIWFVIGILITFSPELAKELSVQGAVAAGKSVMFCYIGLSLGDFASGFLSQYLRSRRKVVMQFILLTAALIVVYAFLNQILPEVTVQIFYGLCLMLGFAVGYWAVFVTNASEQFGTNLRATVTTTVPNFIRGSVVPITLAFQTLKGSFSLTQSALLVGICCIAIAMFSLSRLKETFGKDLNYIEE